MLPVELSWFNSAISATTVASLWRRLPECSCHSMASHKLVPMARWPRYHRYRFLVCSRAFNVAGQGRSIAAACLTATAAFFARNVPAAGVLEQFPVRRVFVRSARERESITAVRCHTMMQAVFFVQTAKRAQRRGGFDNTAQISVRNT